MFLTHESAGMGPAWGESPSCCKQTPQDTAQHLATDVYQRLSSTLCPGLSGPLETPGCPSAGAQWSKPQLDLRIRVGSVVAGLSKGMTAGNS